MRQEQCLDFMKFMLEKTCSHKYVEQKMDRTPNAYFFMFIYVSGIAFHVLKTS